MSGLPWWLYFCILFIKIVSGVQIFSVDPPPAPTRRVKFEPQVISKTCMLKPQKGPCRAGITMYYYDNVYGNCSTFKWGGCQGNGNRFATEEQCMETCLSTERTPKSRPKYCNLRFDYGFCFGAIEVYYFDTLWNVCKKTIYSGCGGNKNNFYSKNQCESICLFKQGMISVTTKKDDGIKKVLIINPISTTSTTRAESIDNNLVND